MATPLHMDLMATTLDKTEDSPLNVAATRWLRLSLSGKQVHLVVQENDKPRLTRQLTFQAGDRVMVRWPDMSTSDEHVEMLSRPPNDSVNLPYIRTKLRGLDQEVPLWLLEVRVEEVLESIVTTIRREARLKEDDIRREFAKASIGE